MNSKVNAVMVLSLLLVSQLLHADANQEYDALKQIVAAMPPWEAASDAVNAAGVREPGNTEWIQWNDQKTRKLTGATLKFYHAYPHDPRRWEAVAMSFTALPVFVKEIKPGLDAAVAQGDRSALERLVIHDKEAEATWRKEMRELVDALYQAPDVTPEVLLEVASYDLTLQSGEFASTVRKELASMKDKIESMERAAPDNPRIARAYDGYLGLLAKLEPGTFYGTLERLLSSQNERVRQMADGRSKVEAAKVEPMQMSFSALDGREVDLKKLRGKVVLVDYWATWCIPCIQELPNVKAVYEKYRDDGFEVIGISLDAAKDKQKLIDFCQNNSIPWPQQFDGKAWKGDIVQKYGVAKVPTMFLLDKDGRIVSDDPRGDQLEPLVRKYLGSVLEDRS